MKLSRTKKMHFLYVNIYVNVHIYKKVICIIIALKNKGRTDVFFKLQ